MTDAWRKYRGAPVEGAVVCALDAVADPGTLCLTMAGFPVLVARSNGLLRAYVNACPHQYLPLDHRGDRIISADGEVLRCTNHQAGFRLGDGEGIEGLGLGCTLDRIPVSVDAVGHIVIGDGRPLAEGREGADRPPGAAAEGYDLRKAEPAGEASDNA